MNQKKHFIQIFFMALILPPLLLTLSMIAGALAAAVIQCIISIIYANISVMPDELMMKKILFITLVIVSAALVLMYWRMYIKSARLPKNLIQRFLPVIIAFTYYIVIWLIFAATGGHNYSGSSFGIPFLIFTSPYYAVYFIFRMIDDFSFFPFIQIIVYGAVFTAAGIFKSKK